MADCNTDPSTLLCFVSCCHEPLCQQCSCPTDRPSFCPFLCSHCPFLGFSFTKFFIPILPADRVWGSHSPNFSFPSCRQTGALYVSTVLLVPSFKSQGHSPYVNHCLTGAFVQIHTVPGALPLCDIHTHTHTHIHTTTPLFSIKFG